MSPLKSLNKYSVVVVGISLLVAVVAFAVFVTLDKFEGFAAYTMPVPTVDGKCSEGYTLVADALDFQMCCVTPDKGRILTVSSDGNPMNGLGFVSGQQMVGGTVKNMHIYDRCVYTTQI